MQLREWDPSVAPDSEIAAWCEAYNRALAVDMPSDPAWCTDSLRGYLSVTMPAERRISWVAEGSQPDRPMLGHASLLMLQDLGVLELFVEPSGRRQGIGRALLATAARRALADGFSSLGVEVVGGTAASQFFEAHGFRLAYNEMRSILDLSTIDWLRMGEMAGGVVPGYHIEYHPGDLPNETLPAYAEAKEFRRLAPAGDLDLRPSSYDPDRLRASLGTLQARGLKPYIVLAIHEKTGKVVGLTEVVVPAMRPARADQYDTVVLPEHRGYGLARALKARMLFELRSAEPLLREVQTWQGSETEHLLQVNEELGFKPDREWREYEADSAEIAEMLRDAAYSHGSAAGS